jgi:hypothetical protein
VSCGPNRCSPAQVSIWTDVKYDTCRPLDDGKEINARYDTKRDIIMSFHPQFWSPALPVELLSYIIHSCVYPTTLIVCSSRAGFILSLVEDSKDREKTEELDDGANAVPATGQASRLLAAPLYQVAVARHIRILFIPTVSHLRAFLSVFSPADSKVPEPPGHDTRALLKHKPPLLLIYGFLALHRDTSEWSVQGLSNSAAIFVETAKRLDFRAIAVEPGDSSEDGTEMQFILEEETPILSGAMRRTGPDLAEGGWAGRTVPVRRVLGRWFGFQERSWEALTGSKQQMSEHPQSQGRTG